MGEESGIKRANHNIKIAKQRRRMNGAAQTYTDIWSRGDPRCPEYQVRKPIIHRGVRDQVCSILPSAVQDSDSDNKTQSEAPAERSVFLMRQDKPRFAYLNTKKVVKKIEHHGRGWGIILLGVMINCTYSQTTTMTASTIATRPIECKTISRDQSIKSLHDSCSTCSTASVNTISTDSYIDTSSTTKLCFQMPAEDEAEYVSIKILQKKVVHQYLKRNGREDPYQEIALMQELGDDIHVLSCLEVLEDDKFLYIITPYCEGGSLMESIPWAAYLEDDNDHPGYSEAEAKILFQQILQILQYLERHGICHHDLSPDNFMFYKDRLVLIDFAMSLRIPRNSTGQRYLVKGQGTYGTYGYLAPEVFAGRTPFDGVYADIWSAAVILYNMLTGYPLYSAPYPTDIIFKYFIMASGMTQDNERTVEIFRSTFQHQDRGQTAQSELLKRVQANLSIPDDARDLLQHLFALNPHNRWSLQQVLDSPWVQNA